MQSALRELAAIFDRNGVLRTPNLARRAASPRSYKKGYELRFIATSKAELKRIQRLLREAGFPVATPFEKVNRLIQPVYGRDHVERFCEYLEEVGHPALDRI